MEETIYIENTTLAYAILKQLVKSGKRDSMFPFDGKFLRSELDEVHSLYLDAGDSLVGIELLKQLKSLTIVAQPNFDQLKYDDYSLISHITTLESLSMYGICNIYELDISFLSDLKVINLINNSNLRNLKGISSLKKLEEVRLCGNDIKEIEDIDIYINNTANTRVNVLDVNMFSNMFGKNLKNRKLLEQKVNSHWSNISFGEMLAFDNECYVLSFYQMLRMYNRANNILTKLKLDNDDDIMKAEKIYNYIVSNISYDFQGLEIRSDFYNNHTNDSYDEYLKKRMLIINSSYGALMLNASVCDGYVNMMRLMLNMCDIENRKVMCNFDNSASELNHVMIKFKSNDCWYYADPEKQQTNKNINLFALKLSEVTKLYKLSNCEENQTKIM